MEFREIDDSIQTIKRMMQRGVVKNIIDKIMLKQFRGFISDSEIEFRFPLTAIVGKNGSGKSTILRIIKMIGKGDIPQHEFFETNFDKGNLAGTEIEYSIDGENVRIIYSGDNKWGIEDNNVENIEITLIRPKAIVGAINKSFLYDNIGQHVNRGDQVKYLIKQSKKVLQSTENTGKKRRKYLDETELEVVNYILQSDYKSIEIIRHKLFGGTWATSVLFSKASDYEVFCEYNAGSGEFLIVNIVEQMERVKNNSILLVDEPEVSLHPGAQRRLLNYLLYEIIAKKIQIVFSTHSKEMVECLPSEAIICLEKQKDDYSRINNNVIPKQAFLEIEVIPEVIQIIVEDDMACSIIKQILKVEKMELLLNVIYVPGGASNLKKHVIPAFSKTNVNSQFIWFDGDQKKDEIPDFRLVLEKEKDEKYYRNVFSNCVGIDSKNIAWCPDGNKKEGRINKQQEIAMIIKYLDYYRSNVFFLPMVIPEDIVYDEKYLQLLLQIGNIPTSVMQAKNSKEKIKKWSEESDMPLGLIEENLVYRFVKTKDDTYQEILSTMRTIIGE
jgi:predicted ATPase